MKIVTENEKKIVKMSKKDWTNIGKKAGWNKSESLDISKQILAELNDYYYEKLYPLLTKDLRNEELRAELEKFVNNVHNFRKYLSRTPKN